ncbi:MAG TPA: general secretion pathway protein [Chromatiales bacterium]|nr:general secretion pathway protein [Chromatiales bacterium]
MYEDYYGLREKPFSLLPDPNYLMFSSKHRLAYSLLEYGLNYSEGFTIITGEIGCGKTTLVRHLLKSAGPLVTFGFISDTIRLKGEILERVLLAFGLEVREEGDGWTEKFQRFAEFAVDEYSKGRRLVVVVDEAQNMDEEALEELRVLSNLNAEQDLLIQIILTGQPELRMKLATPRLKQFAQRIGKLYHLLPLDSQETQDYIHHRIQVAGGDPNLFTNDACDVAFEGSGGVPRLINQLCDTALVYGYGLEKQVIDKEIMDMVLQDRMDAWVMKPEVPPPGPADQILVEATNNTDESGSSISNTQTVFPRNVAKTLKK